MDSIRFGIEIVILELQALWMYHNLEFLWNVKSKKCSRISRYTWHEYKGYYS